MCPLRCLGPYYENPLGAPRKADTYVDLPPSRPRKAYSTGKQARASRKLLALHWPFCAGWRGAWTWQHTLLAANMLQPALPARRRSSGAHAPAGGAAGPGRPGFPAQARADPRQGPTAGHQLWFCMAPPWRVGEAIRQHKAREGLQATGRRCIAQGRIAVTRW